ncbi:hypothetical protein D9M68_663830 [compost metagenome]
MHAVVRARRRSAARPTARRAACGDHSERLQVRRAAAGRHRGAIARRPSVSPPTHRAGRKRRAHRRRWHGRPCGRAGRVCRRRAAAVAPKAGTPGACRPWAARARGRRRVCRVCPRAPRPTAAAGRAADEGTGGASAAWRDGPRQGRAGEHRRIVRRAAARAQAAYLLVARRFWMLAARSPEAGCELSIELLPPSSLASFWNAVTRPSRLSFCVVSRSKA